MAPMQLMHVDYSHNLLAMICNMHEFTFMLMLSCP